MGLLDFGTRVAVLIFFGSLFVMMNSMLQLYLLQLPDFMRFGYILGGFILILSTIRVNWLGIK